MAPAFFQSAKRVRLAKEESDLRRKIFSTLPHLDWGKAMELRRMKAIFEGGSEKTGYAFPKDVLGWVDRKETQWAIPKAEKAR